MTIKKKKKNREFDMEGLKGVKVTTPPFTIAFPKLFKPVPYQEGDKPAYSCVMLFDKKIDRKEIIKAVTRAKVEAFGDEKDAWPDITVPWRNGDDNSDYAGYEGTIYANTKTYNKPLVIDRDKQTIEIESDIYPGAVCRAVIVVKAVESGGKYYITFYLQAVQKIKDGENLAGGANAKDFDDLEDDEDDIDLDDDDGSDDSSSDDDDDSDDD